MQVIVGGILTLLTGLIVLLFWIIMFDHIERRIKRETLQGIVYTSILLSINLTLIISVIFCFLVLGDAFQIEYQPLFNAEPLSLQILSKTIGLYYKILVISFSEVFPFILALEFIWLTRNIKRDINHN